MDVHPKYPQWMPACFRTGWLISRKINQTFASVVEESVAEKLFAVEGHITARQCATLFYFAYAGDGSGRVVEIGTFKGKSTVWMAQALKQRAEEGAKVAAIDPHINTKDTEVVPDYQEESSYEAFMNNVSSAGLDEWVEPVKKMSADAAKDWNQPIRLLFIDGSHRYEDVLLDLQLWEPDVNAGGIIILHDTKPIGPFPGVRRAINEYLRSSSRFEEVIQLLNLTVFRKLSSN